MISSYSFSSAVLGHSSDLRKAPVQDRVVSPLSLLIWHTRCMSLHCFYYRLFSSSQVPLLAYLLFACPVQGYQYNARVIPAIYKASFIQRPLVFCVSFREYWNNLENIEVIECISVWKWTNQARPVNNAVYMLSVHLSVTIFMLPGEVVLLLHPTQKGRLCNEVAWWPPWPCRYVSTPFGCWGLIVTPS